MTGNESARRKPVDPGEEVVVHRTDLVDDCTEMDDDQMEMVGDRTWRLSDCTDVVRSPRIRGEGIAELESTTSLEASATARAGFKT